MKKESLLVLDRTIEYSIKESRLAQRMRVAVYADGDVIATKPIKTSPEILRKFIESKKLWIVKKLEQRKIQIVPELKENSRIHFLKNKIAARELVKAKLDEWGKKLELEYSDFKIKQLRSRWGSCSSSKKLSFNYKILFLPEAMQNYIIVHELCHFKEMNHSKRFWSMIAQTLPNYLQIKNNIKKI